jgi:hypothetical protein
MDGNKAVSFHSGVAKEGEVLNSNGKGSTSPVLKNHITEIQKALR